LDRTARGERAGKEWGEEKYRVWVEQARGNEVE